MKITLLERLEDDLPIGRIWIEELQGVPVPRALIGGATCDLETKPDVLEAGLASCNPLDPELGLDWPMQARVRYEDSDGIASEMVLECVSADPRLVAAVQRFNVLALAGEATPGMEL